MSERPPITPEYLERQGPPMVMVVGPRMLAIVAGDGRETVDLLPEQAEHVANRLLTWARLMLLEESE